MRALTLLILLLVPCVTSAAENLKIELKRTTYWRGETIHFNVQCLNESAEPLSRSLLKVTIGSWVNATVSVPEIKAQKQVTIPVTLSTQALKSGQYYPLQIKLVAPR